MPNKLTVSQGENFDTSLTRICWPSTVSHSAYVARTADVTATLRTRSTRQLRADLHGYWADLWTKADIRRMPDYVIAVILNQI